ncbi:MAG: YiiX family permuted papain-like enzyme [Acidobacteria bacterium]|nr:YiiX family permuted papain-like enzyme [Acidobacteriota bacterium]
MVLLFIFLAMFGCSAEELPAFKDGDLVFQDVQSSQSAALKIATHSPYTHMGVIFVEEGKQFVYEAVGPVKYTPLKKWIRQGLNGHFVVKRLKDREQILTEGAVRKLKESGEIYEGRPYDFHFGWSEDRIYCSELAWKMYNTALGIEIGGLQRFRDFDLSDPAVVKILKQRFPEGVPGEEIVISPASIFESDLLLTVYEN